MRLIDAEQQVTVTIYDEEHEEHLDKIMTVEEMLDTYTNEGCPTICFNPERKGKWIWKTENIYQCTECEVETHVDEYMEKPIYNFCPYCGARMVSEDAK